MQRGYAFVTKCRYLLASFDIYMVESVARYAPFSWYGQAIPVRVVELN